jgi:C-terminal processing protease CtpA/Prc
VGHPPYLTWQGNFLEGKGVYPQANVELPYEVLKSGRDIQLERTIELARNA